MENNSFFDDKQNKAFSNMRKGGQFLEATQGIEDFLKEQGHTDNKETVIDVGQSSLQMMNRQGQIVDVSCFESEANLEKNII